MFASARHEAQRSVSSAQFADQFNVTLSPQFLPNKYSIAAIASEVVPKEPPEDLQKKHEIILLINTCFSQIERLSRQPTAALHFNDARADGNDETNLIRSIMLTISEIIRPDGNLFISDQLTDAQKKTALDRIRHIGELGLSSILCLHSLFPEDDGKKLDDHIIFSLLAFSSISDPWTTQTSFDLANNLLSVYRADILQEEFIAKSVLSSFIRPLFSASKPKAITSSGYAAIPSYTPREPQDFSAWDLASKPWRIDTCFALSVLSWVLNHASVSIPPYLIENDYSHLLARNSPNTEMQLKGLKLHISFVPKLTPKLLEQTGLGAVIEEAIHPILLYLPPITPKNECLSLLPIAFDSFFILHEVRFPSSTISDIRDQDQAKQKQKLNSLTRLLRQAIAPAYNHTCISSESDPMIKKIILDQILPLVRALGIHSVAYLQTLLKLIEEPLLDPFAAASLPTILAALEALKEIVLCAWPRLSEERRRIEVIRMLVSAWRKVCNESNNSTEALRKEVIGELKILGRLFVKAVGTSDEIDLSCDLNPLVAVDNSLKELFGI